MKFKLIFFIFNGIVIFSFLFIALLPVLMLGWSYALPFWENSWYLLLIFLVILGILDGYFIYNWKLFSLLEAKDWGHLQSWLEDSLGKRQRISEQRAQVLVHTYIMASQFSRIAGLERILAEKQPGTHKRLILSLAVGYLLENDNNGLLACLSSVVAEDGKSGLPHRGWALWLLAYARLRNEEREQAERLFAQVFREGKDLLARVLALYMFIDILGNEADGDMRLFIREQSKRHSIAAWAELVNSQKDKLHVFALSGLLMNAGEWMQRMNLTLMDEPIAQAAPSGENMPETE